MRNVGRPCCLFWRRKDSQETRAAGKYIRKSVRGEARSDCSLRPQRAELDDSKKGFGRVSAQPVQMSARFHATTWQTGVEGFKHLALPLSEHFSDLDNIPYSPSSPGLKPFGALGRQFLGFCCPLVDEDKIFTYSWKSHSLDVLGKTLASSLLNCSNHPGILD